MGLIAEAHGPEPEAFSSRFDGDNLMSYREQELARSGLPFARGDRVRVTETVGEGLLGVVSGWDRHPDLPVHFAVRLVPQGQWVYLTADRLILVTPVTSDEQARRELAALKSAEQE